MAKKRKFKEYKIGRENIETLEKGELEKSARLFKLDVPENATREQLIEAFRDHIDSLDEETG